VRTDAAAGHGYNGLPPAFTERNLKATTVIVADPNVASALATGGYAATEYLNSAFARRGRQPAALTELAQTTAARPGRRHAGQSGRPNSTHLQ
jgi:hypothetical protein